MWSLYIVYHFWILFLFVCLLEKSRRNFSFTKHTLNARFAAVRTHTHRERERERERERKRKREREKERESSSSSSSLHPNSKSNSQKATPQQIVRQQIITSKTNIISTVFSPAWFRFAPRLTFSNPRWCRPRCTSRVFSSPSGRLRSPRSFVFS